MGLRDSRAIKLLREQGIKPFVSHYVRKSIKILNKKSVFLLLNFYPKLVLSKSQYKTFRSVYQHFEENYKNIILISPLFFMNHIKRHIIWLESQEFKNEYGGVEYLIDIHTQTLGENTTTHNGVATFPNHIGRFGADCHDLDSRFTDSLIDTYTYPFYPPLLEPANTDYSTIDSKIALELRLPPKMGGGGVV